MSVPGEPRSGRNLDPRRRVLAWAVGKSVTGQRAVTWKGYLLVGAAIIGGLIILSVAGHHGWSPALFMIIPLILILGIGIFIRR
jgi:hypothetical protein